MWLAWSVKGAPCSLITTSFPYPHTKLRLETLVELFKLDGLSPEAGQDSTVHVYMYMHQILAELSSEGRKSSYMYEAVDHHRD